MSDNAHIIDTVLDKLNNAEEVSDMELIKLVTWANSARQAINIFKSL